MKRNVLFGMASAAVVALVLALNLTGSIGQTSTVNAAAQTNTAQTANIEKTNYTAKTGDGAASKTDDSTAIKADTIVQDETAQTTLKPQTEVPVDLEVEKGDQRNADAGHSPWKLDPVFVSQVFVSLKISPDGIQGDYPVKQEELKIVKNTVSEAEVEVNSGKTDIKKIYLKRLIKQDSTGIWTVVGYDSAIK